MISVKNIYKNFGSLQVLKGVSCEVQKGEKVVIIGPSGSGKSTLLRCMNLLEIPTYGEIWLEDKLLTPIDPYLHFEVIRLSNTYRAAYQVLKEKNPELSDQEIDAEVIRDIKANDLLKKNEGKEYKQEIKRLFKQSYIDINLARQKVGMVFQHFNLFNNLTVLKNLTLAPVMLKLKTQEEATQKAMELLERIGLADKANAHQFIANSSEFLLILPKHPFK